MTRLLRLWETMSPVLLIILFCAVAGAQRGGKAEPNRIEFKRGATSTTINGTVRGSEAAEYLLAGRKGQRVIMRLRSVPARSAVFQILDPDNDKLSLAQGNFELLGTLPKSGDYLITVSRPKQSKGTSRYKLIVMIR